MKADAAELLARLKESPRFVEAFAHGTMSVELYAPVGIDPQTPHAQDELYFIHSGSGTFRLAGELHDFHPGTTFFVAAGVEHRFETFTEDFATWVVFWGPKGGETEK